MSRTDPSPKAILKPLALISLLAILLAVGLRSAYPAADLMYTVAQIGIAVVFAFIVEIVWIGERADRSDGNDHRDWLGVSCGLAFAGMLGVALSLAVGAHREAGHANFLDAIGLWWSVASLALLGVVVAIQPWITDLYREKAEMEKRSSGS